MIKFLYIDLFCGAGGTSTGIHLAKVNGSPVALVVAAVNHDPIAIESHSINHPDTLHFIEDIRTLNLDPLLVHLAQMKAKYPHAMVVLWASLECTNFSNAKGGQPRNGDSRTLAEHLYKYVKALKPHLIQIENVMEFRSWGPLDEFGKPISKDSGSDYLKWISTIKKYGYNYDWKALNSADFGAYTCRNRFFAQFALVGLPIVWPKQTHAKKGKSFGMLSDWKPVKEVLDIHIKGESIFSRKKNLSPNTLARIYAGLEKFVAGGKDQAHSFLTSYYGGGDSGRCRELATPSPVITTQNRIALVQPIVDSWLCQTYAVGSKDDGIFSSETPTRTVTTRDATQIVQPQFLAKHFSGKPEGMVQSVDCPTGVITTVDHHAIVSLLKYYSNGDNIQDVESPSPTITTKDTAAVVTTEFLVNPSWGGHNCDIEQPCPVIIASQHKAPLYVAHVENYSPTIEIEPSDCKEMVKIKQFCIAFGIGDIYMRMLNVSELKRIQGFPESYVLKGSQKDQKKHLGNAVIPHITKVMVEAMAEAYSNL